MMRGSRCEVSPNTLSDAGRIQLKSCLIFVQGPVPLLSFIIYISHEKWVDLTQYYILPYKRNYLNEFLDFFSL